MTRYVFFCFACGVCASALAFQNEPSGFRNIEWGADFSHYQSEMTAHRGAASIDMYSRLNDKLSIGDAKLQYLAYIFYDGKFASVMFTSTGNVNKIALIKIFKKQFGERGKMNRSKHIYHWHGNKTEIALDCDKPSDGCTGILWSVEHKARRAEKEKAAAQDAKNGL